MNLLSAVDLANIDIDECLTHSYKDFHAKGLDYVCLKRTPELTVKAYFFEGLDQKPGEVINPHDHRYPFVTQCYSGTIRNKWYHDAVDKFDCTTGYQEWEWRTPLNGGDGFTWKSVRWLEELRHQDFRVGQGYWMEHDELHTIQVMRPETCIVLFQFGDLIPLEQPTFTYTQALEAPSLKGLYREFKPDELVKRIELLRALVA